MSKAIAQGGDRTGSDIQDTVAQPAPQKDFAAEDAFFPLRRDSLEFGKANGDAGPAGEDNEAARAAAGFAAFGEDAADKPISAGRADRDADANAEPFADLSDTLDELERRLRQQGGAKVDAALLKSALKEVEAELRNFARRRARAARAGDRAAPTKSGLETALRGAFPFRFDLLARLNTAMAAAAWAEIGGRDDLAELARKLDAMCHGGVPTRASLTSEADAQAPARENAVDPATPDEARGRAESAHAPTIETLRRQIEGSAFRFENAAATGLRPDRRAPRLDQMAENRDLAAAAPSPTDQSQVQGEQQGQFSAESSAGPDHNHVSPKSEGLGAAAREILALLKDSGRAAASQTLEARLDDFSLTAEQAFATDADRGQSDTPSNPAKPASGQVGALRAADLAGSPETEAPEDLVGPRFHASDPAEDAQSANLAIETLRQEIAKIAERLDGADKAFASLASLETSIAALFEQLEETRRTAREAVAAAERSSSPDSIPRAELSEAAAHGAKIAIGQSVAGDIAELRAALEAADRRVDLTLIALRETVDKVADRLVKAEADIAAMRPSRLGSLLAPNLTPIFPQRAERRPAESAAIGASSTSSVAAYSGHANGKPSFEAGPFDPSDILLEPGSGFPQRREKSEPTRSPSQPLIPSSALDNILHGDPANRGDFIAAARRAAQATQKPPPDLVQGEARADAELRERQHAGLLARTRSVFRTRKWLALLILATVFFAASAYDVARKAAQTASIDALAPRLLRQLGKALAHGEGPPPADEASANARGESAPPPHALPGLLDASKLAPPPRVGAENPAGKLIAGGAPIMGGALERSDGLRQIAADPAPADAIAAPELKPSEPEQQPRARAEAGDAAAQFELGLRFAEGRDRARDLRLAAQWYDKAARQGLAKAQYQLAILYERGLGVPRDLARAVNLYLAAAQSGNTRAMHNLGVLAAENSDGRPDYATAALWFAKAAECGVTDSQFNLAVLLARGLGPPQDLAKAYSWFAIAAAQGDAEAGRRRDEIGARLAAGDLVAAQKTAKAFRPREVDQAANEAPGAQGGADAAQSGGRQTADAPKLSGL